MAHFLLTTIGSAGDVFPMLALGRAMKARGHRVSFLYNPYFQEAIEEAGLDFLPLGTRQQFERLMSDPDLWHPVRGFQFIVREAILGFMRPTYEALQPFDPGETILVSSGMVVGPRLAQEKRGFRLATIHLQSALFLSAHNPPEAGGMRMPKWWPLRLRQAWFSFVETKIVDRALSPAFNDYRAELGLSPASRFYSRWMHSPDLVLGLWPKWYSRPQPDWPPGVELTGFVKYETGDQGIPERIERFLDGGEPPIVFTPGSAMQHGAKFFSAAVEASVRLGRRAILLSRFKEHLPDRFPGSVVHAEWLPLSRVLPRAALMVHHGGIGTTAQVLKAGVPHLVMPLAHDQPDNANILKGLGVGARLDPRRFTSSRLTRLLAHLLSDAGIKANVRRYAQRVDFETALEDSCRLLERLAHG